MLPSSSAMAENIKSLFYVGNGFRRALIQPGAEPASRRDGKKRLADLIASHLIVRERILPGLDAHPDVGKQKVRACGRS